MYEIALYAVAGASIAVGSFSTFKWWRADKRAYDAAFYVPARDLEIATLRAQVDSLEIALTAANARGNSAESRVASLERRSLSVRNKLLISNLQLFNLRSHCFLRTPRGHFISYTKADAALQRKAEGGEG